MAKKKISKQNTNTEDKTVSPVLSFLKHPARFHGAEKYPETRHPSELLLFSSKPRCPLWLRLKPQYRKFWRRQGSVPGEKRGDRQ